MDDLKFSIQRAANGERTLFIQGVSPSAFHGTITDGGFVCPLDAHNARAIRQYLLWSAPQRVGSRLSFGLGDRLGISTQGHLRAIKGTGIFPVLAQQSMREMQRAHRSPQQVIDDVTWAVVEADYRDGYGCDADHLKTIEEIDACVDAGFVGYTVDPGAFVHDEFADGERKYGEAMAHVATLYNHLVKRLGKDGFDFEVSVDETATATTHAQHRFIALELQRLSVTFQGLAPRFVGDFMKGIDYIGDLEAFEADYKAHAQIAHELGDYKLSVHSGSDKFSIYPIVAKYSPSALHVKTSGTSWLEALRIIALHDAPLFRAILALASEGYTQNRQSYHVNGRVEAIPLVSDAELPTLLNHPDARQVVHVAFGATLATYYDAIYAVLNAHIEDYWQALETHIRRHVAAFVST